MDFPEAVYTFNKDEWDEDALQHTFHL